MDGLRLADDSLSSQVVAGGLDDVERVLDQHARRLAGQLGGLLVDLGQALRKQAEAPEPAPKPPRRPRAGRTATSRRSGAVATRSDLLREAAKLGIPGRSRMSKADLESAIREHRGTSGRA
jgi:hypothetical protein